MLRFIVNRFLQTIPVLFVLITATFFLLREAPGGPFTSEKAVSPEVQRNLEAYYKLDKPLYVQYLIYMKNVVLHGDLGPSYRYVGQSVNDIIDQKLPVSMELGVLSLLVALVVGLVSGILSSLKPNSWLDYLPASFSTVGICIPTFVLGPVFVLVFALGLGWFDASGWYTPADRVLPALTLGLYYAAYIARLARGGMREILSQDFIRTARAKGASETRIILKHALKGGLLPVVSFLGPATAGIISGSFVIETIFQIPGLGRSFVTSVTSRDYMLILGTTIVYACLIIVMNLVVDIIQVWLNPKLRF